MSSFRQRVTASPIEKTYLSGLILYILFLSGLVDAASTTPLKRRAEIPEGVPDYVLSYGMFHFPSYVGLHLSDPVAYKNK